MFTPLTLAGCLIAGDPVFTSKVVHFHLYNHNGSGLLWNSTFVDHPPHLAADTTFGSLSGIARASSAVKYRGAPPTHSSSSATPASSSPEAVSLSASNRIPAVIATSPVTPTWSSSSTVSSQPPPQESRSTAQSPLSTQQHTPPVSAHGQAPLNVSPGVVRHVCVRACMPDVCTCVRVCVYA